jgi:hypothetical protein
MSGKATVKWRMSFTERGIDSNKCFFLISLADRKTSHNKDENEFFPGWRCQLTD